jgi:large subunit ribosomal protein L17
MRHRKHRSKLNRTSEHRAALLRNLTIALVRHERIRTTKQKAAAVRPFAESLITLARSGSLHSRRLAFSRLQDKDTVFQLFHEIGPRVADRDGGYLRIVKDGRRMGDGAEMAYLEFVDQRVDTGDADAPKDLEKLKKQKLHQARKDRAKMRRA